MDKILALLKQRKEIKAVFVHLPKISEQWPLSKLLKAVKQLILATIS